MKFSKEPSFAETGLRSVITEFAIELASFKDDNWHPSGTAVIIGPQLAIAARHVVEDHWKTHEYNKMPKTEPSKHTNLAGSFPLVAYQGLKEGMEGALWSITKLWLSPHTDVAFVQLTPWSKSATNYVWRRPILNLAPPEVGSRISGFGYHSPEIRLAIEDNVCKVHWKSSPTTTIGEVIKVYEQRRERGMLNFPCFEVNAQFKGGMSGGPIFNENGQLCGLICSSLPPSDGQAGSVSYVCTLWPSMATKIDLRFQKFEPGKLYPVLDLAREGVIEAVGWEKVILVMNTFGNIEKVGWDK